MSEKADYNLRIVPKLNNFLITFIIFSLPGFLASIVWLFISIILFFSVVLGIAGSSETSISSLELKEIQSSSSSEGILVYEMNGPITSYPENFGSGIPIIDINQVEEDFDLIKEDENIKNVVFSLNTPGGEVYASKVLGDLMSDLASHFGSEQPVFYFGQISASGGLLSTYKVPNNYIIGNPYGQTGSIGVIIALNNLKELGDNIGYKQIIFETGELKSAASPFQDLSQAERNYIQERLDEEFENFKQVVQTGRNLDSSEVDTIATGEVFTNQEAKNLGLLDEVGKKEDAIKLVAEKTGLTDYKVWEIEKELSFSEILFAKQPKYALQSFFNSSFNQNLNQIVKYQPGMVYAVDQNRF